MDSSLPTLRDQNAFLRLKWLLFPGVNLHARLRNRSLPKFFGGPTSNGARRVLDAGCGNGMLSYQAYLKGNRVLGISLKPEEVEGSRRMFNEFLGIPEDKLRFARGSLYELEFPDASFDEIICTEVLEHLSNDRQVCASFWRWLKPGGVLHITAPNAEHPYNASFDLDTHETGGHVRTGYTVESYKKLLEPLGFNVATSAGLGGPIRQKLNRGIRDMQIRFGAGVGLPLFMLAAPILLLELPGREPRVPFSIYVKAVKTTS